MIEEQENMLVTFILFAYNQELYIGEAVESALAQDYSPLEIILSDDHSTDSTFEIMSEMVAQYSGLHRVVVRRNPSNLGTAAHVQAVFNDCAGELLVVAAGDDISVAGRVTALYRCWNQAGRPDGVVHSGWEAFSVGEKAFVKQYPSKKTHFIGTPLEGFTASHWLPAAAPTVAYTRNVFEKFPPLLGGSIIEDMPLFFRAALAGSFTACEEMLVRVRIHDDNLGSGYTVKKARAWNRLLRSKLIAFLNMQSDLAESDLDVVFKNRVERRILASARSVSNLLLPLTFRFGNIQKVLFFFRMIFAPVVARTFRLRIEYALSFFGFKLHLVVKEQIRRLFRL